MQFSAGCCKKNTQARGAIRRLFAARQGLPSDLSDGLEPFEITYIFHDIATGGNPRSRALAHPSILLSTAKIARRGGIPNRRDTLLIRSVPGRFLDAGTLERSKAGSARFPAGSAEIPENIGLMSFSRAPTRSPSACSPDGARRNPEFSRLETADCGAHAGQVHPGNPTLAHLKCRSRQTQGKPEIGPRASIRATTRFSLSGSRTDTCRRKCRALPSRTRASDRDHA